MFSVMIIMDIVLFLMVGVAALINFEAGIRKNSWVFTGKWAAFAATAIFLIANLIPELEFVRMALAFFIGAVVMAKITSRAIR